MIKDYQFQEELRWSFGTAPAAIESILLENIPGAVSVGKSSGGEDRQGIDYWVYRRYTHPISVDLKQRRDDPLTFATPKDDLALETWSVKERNIGGWTLDEKKRTDYILWHFAPTGRWVLIPFPMLCAVFQQNQAEWAQQYQTATQSTDNGRYHSECIFVPRNTVWRALYERYGGLTPHA